MLALTAAVVIPLECVATRRSTGLSAERNGDLGVFSAEITSRLEPLYSRVYEDAETISCEIEQVASILKETADRLLPSFEPKRRKKW